MQLSRRSLSLAQTEAFDSRASAREREGGTRRWFPSIPRASNAGYDSSRCGLLWRNNGMPKSPTVLRSHARHHHAILKTEM
jgi:hypothetical protein